MTMFCESFPMHLRTQFNKLHYIRFFNFHTGQESWGDYVIGGLRAPSGHAWLDRKVPTVRLSGAKSRNDSQTITSIHMYSTLSLYLCLRSVFAVHHIMYQYA